LWLVVGLGNPGRKYEFTRHNVGFMVIDRLCRDFGIHLKRFEMYMLERTVIKERDLILLKPLTYMNRSGLAVEKVCNSFNLPSEKVLVIHDDLDMALGKIRFKKKGSSGGHRGVQSIIDAIGENFMRLKIGIGRSSEIPPEEYVLQRFNEEELKVIDGAITKTVERIFEIIPPQLLTSSGNNFRSCDGR
jgi:PTH1 family peptidyl-tRNA hydrolase